MLTTHAYRKDAEAAGKYALAYLRPRHRADRDASVDVIYWLARWAGHWARRALPETSAEHPSW